MINKDNKTAINFVNAFTNELFMNYYESKEVAKIAAYEFCKYFKSKDEEWFGNNNDIIFWENIIKEIEQL